MAKNSVCFRFPERVRTTSKDKCYDVRKNRGLILLSAILVLWTMSVFSSWCFAKDRTEKDGDSLLSTFVADGMPQEILFAVRKPSFDGHWYANFGFYSLDEKKYTFPRNSGGKLCIYNTQTKKIRTIFEDTQGNIRDPQLHYDGRRIVFSYLPAGKCHYSLFTINIDGTGLKQLTGLEKECLVNNVSGQPIQRTCGWDDIEPTWLPDDQIIFCSSRCNRYVQCWLTQVATLHKCNADGSNVRQLSCNVEHDNTPWVLSNGQIAYMRWEYIDRNHLMFHHLWTMNPNGTRQMVLFGNQKPGGVFLDPKPIPNSNKIIFVYSPGHGKKEHYGRLALFDPLYGPDSEKGLEFVTEKNDYTDPWPFSDSSFLAVCKTKVVLIDRDGREETLFQLPAELIKQGFWIGEPRPVTKRDREPIIADTIDPASDHGSFILTNIYQGRKMQEVRPGNI
ncbi:MAG: hypothetical protein PHQ75_03990, partial [Thermoguttaceae bacterium]|nr:hypothetical protein [Thermoguttaceae bacterium]